METTNHIGTKLFKIRDERGETQEHVAECVGITYVTLSRYENGQRMPKMNILARLADHYGVSVDEIIGRDDAETKKEPATAGGLDAEFNARVGRLNPANREKMLAYLDGLLDSQAEQAP